MKTDQCVPRKQQHYFPIKSASFLAENKNERSKRKNLSISMQNNASLRTIHSIFVEHTLCFVIGFWVEM